MERIMDAVPNNNKLGHAFANTGIQASSDADNTQIIELSGGQKIRVQAADEDVGRLTKLAETVAETDLGKELIEKSFNGGYTIMPVTGTRSFGSCDEKKKQVKLNFTNTDDKLVATLAHEMRHAGQFEDGVKLDPQKESVKSYLITDFAIEADANVNAAKVCWNLKEQGNVGPWNDFAETYANIATAYKDGVEKGGKDNGHADTAAFKAWYANIGTRRIYENSYVKRLDKEVPHKAKFDKESFSRETPVAEIVETVCKNGKGGTYFTDKPEVLESPEFLNAGHENWWSYWRLYNRQHGMDSEAANKKMESVTRRTGDEGFGFFEQKQQKGSVEKDPFELSSKQKAMLKAYRNKNEYFSGKNKANKIAANVVENVIMAKKARNG